MFLGLLRRSVPVWLFIIGILATASVTTAVFVLPSLVQAKPDISLMSFPSSPTVLAGGQGQVAGSSFIINVRSANNFTGVVSANIAQPPVGITARFDGNQAVNLDAILLGHSQNVTVDFAATLVGNFTLTLDFTSGALFRSIGVPIISQGLGVTDNPSPLTVARGSSASTVATLHSQNGLTGNITIDTIRMPPPGIAMMTFSPKTVILPRGGTAQMTLTIQAFSSASTGSATQYFDWEVFGSVEYKTDSITYVVS